MMIMIVNVKRRHFLFADTVKSKRLIYFNWLSLFILNSLFNSWLIQILLLLQFLPNCFVAVLLSIIKDLLYCLQFSLINKSLLILDVFIVLIWYSWHWSLHLNIFFRWLSYLIFEIKSFHIFYKLLQILLHRWLLLRTSIRVILWSWNKRLFFGNLGDIEFELLWTCIWGVWLVYYRRCIRFVYDSIII